MVVSFDVKKTLDQFTEQVSARPLDEAQIKVLTERFMISPNAELQDWQRRHDALIPVTPAVASGAGDITGKTQIGVAHRVAAGDSNW